MSFDVSRLRIAMACFLLRLAMENNMFMLYNKYQETARTSMSTVVHWFDSDPKSQTPKPYRISGSSGQMAGNFISWSRTTSSGTNWDWFSGFSRPRLRSFSQPSKTVTWDLLTMKIKSYIWSA